VTDKHLSCTYNIFSEGVQKCDGDDDSTRRYDGYDKPFIIHYWYNENDKKICHYTEQYEDSDYKYQPLSDNHDGFMMGEIYVIEL